jgi:hypothetical protein
MRNYVSHWHFFQWRINKKETCYFVVRQTINQSIIRWEQKQLYKIFAYIMCMCTIIFISFKPAAHDTCGTSISGSVLNPKIKECSPLHRVWIFKRQSSYHQLQSNKNSRNTKLNVPEFTNPNFYKHTYANSWVR